MKTRTPPLSDRKTDVPLYTVKAGRAVRIIEPGGTATVYMINRHTDIEQIHPPSDTIVVTNLTTGRICFKPGYLMVSLLTATVTTEYREV